MAGESAETTLLFRAINEASGVIEAIGKDMDGLTGKVKGFGQEQEKTKTSIADWIESNKKSLRSVGTLITGVGAYITGMAALSINAAEDERTSIAQLAQALKNIGTSYETNKAQIEAVIEAEMRKTNYGDEEQRNALNTLVTVTRDYGLSLQALTVVIDFAAWKHMDLNSAALIVGKSLEGNTAGLSRYGIEVQKGATQTEILGAFMQQCGGQAEAAANPLTELKNVMGELFAAVGTLLLPALKAVIDVLIKIIEPIKFFIEHTGTAGKVIMDLVVAVGLLALTIGPIMLLLPKLAAGMVGLRSATATLSGISGIGGLTSSLGAGGLLGILGPVGIALGVVAAVGTGLYFGIKKLTEGSMQQDEALNILNMTFGQAILKYHDMGMVYIQANQALKDQNMTLGEYRAKQKDATAAVSDAIDATTGLTEAQQTMLNSLDTIDTKYLDQNSVLGKLGISYEEIVEHVHASGLSLEDMAVILDKAGVAEGDVTGAAKAFNLTLQDQYDIVASNLLTSLDKLEAAWQLQQSEVGKLGISYNDLYGDLRNLGIGEQEIDTRMAANNVTEGDAIGLAKIFGSELGNLTQYSKAYAEAQAKINEESKAVNDTWLSSIGSLEQYAKEIEWQNSDLGKLGVTYQALKRYYVEANGSLSSLTAAIQMGIVVDGDAQSLISRYPELFAPYIASLQAAKSATDAATGSLAAYLAEVQAQGAITAAGISDAVNSGNARRAVEGWIGNMFQGLQAGLPGNAFSAIEEQGLGIYGTGTPEEVTALNTWLSNLSAVIGPALAALEATGGTSWYYTGAQPAAGSFPGFAGTPTWTPEAIAAIQAALEAAGLSFASGGIVPGPLGMPSLAVVHGGEVVSNPHLSGTPMAGSKTIIIQTSLYLDESGRRKIAESTLELIGEEARIIGIT